MPNLSVRSTVISNNNNKNETDEDDEQAITSLAFLHQKQHNERITANNLACDEKHSLSIKFVA
jgi:hypothetical protein